MKLKNHLNNLYFSLFVAISKLWFFKLYKGEIVNIQNIENLINENKPFMLAANHSSYFDWMVLYVVLKEKYNKKVYFLAKEKLFSKPFLSPLMEVGEAIKVNEEQLSQESLKKIIRLKKSNSIIGIFPEGTRSATGSLLKNSKNGAVKLSLLLNIPLIPVGLTNFHKMWPRNSILPKLNLNKTKASISFGSPIKVISGDPKIIVKGTTPNELLVNNQTSILMEKIQKLAYK